MWHEAKKQERKIHGIIVDYRKRAERRREFYEKIKQDPTQFLRVHARVCKIHLDPAVALAAEGPGTMMPWQGDTTNMIDRFDARAHLDSIPGQSVISAISSAPLDPDEEKCFYERYRTLVQNEGAGISEEQCLHQIQVDEMFPEVNPLKPNEDKEKLKGKRAAIGFSYSDSSKEVGQEEGEDDGDDDEKDESNDDDDDSSSDTSLSDIDIDINVDVDELTEEQRAELSAVGERYGMKSHEYVRMLEKDKRDLDMQKRFKEIEEEKALYAGRKSRRERRMLVEKRLRARGEEKPSPPSYASRDSPTYQDYQRPRSRSRSRSSTPEDTGKVTFITSFGEEQEEERKDQLARTSTSKSAAASSKLLSGSESHSKSRKHQRPSSSSSDSSSRSRSRSPVQRRHRYHSNSGSSSRSSSRGRHGHGSSSSRSSSRSQSRSRSRSPHRGHRHSRSRSSDRHGVSHHSQDRYRPSRSRSPSRWTRRTRSRSRSRDRSRDRSQDRSRDRSRDRYRGRSRSRSLEKRNRPQSTSGSIKNKRPAESSVGNTPGSAAKKQMTPKERLKLKMQKALNKQHKADKIKQHRKQSAKEQEQIDREEELREMTRHFRFKEQEKRDRERSVKTRRGRGHIPRSRSRSCSRSPERRRRYGHDRYSPARGRSRSRSYSPRPAQYRY